MVDGQVDDNGESYWIFESRDVRGRLFSPSLLRAHCTLPPSLHDLPTPSTLGEYLDS
jgi:hypothetical protein